MIQTSEDMNFSDLVEILSQVQASAPSWLQYDFMLCVRACQFSASLLQLDVFACVCKRTGATTLGNKTVNSMLPVSGGLLNRNFP